MRIEEFVTVNFGPFRGENRVKPRALAYGVIARKVGEEGRSNFIGKTMTFEAVSFALWGWLNPERKQGVDGWISRGEKEGSVKLTLSDGTVVYRSRKGAQSTKLTVTKGAETLIQDAAQARIEELLGMSEEDYFLLSHLRQRQMARIVLASPGDRMDIVAGWLQLGAVEKAHEHAAEKLADLASKRGAVAQNRRIAEELLARTLGPGGTDEKISGEIDAAAKHLERVRNSLAAAEADQDVSAAAAQGARDVEEYKRIVADGKRLALVSHPPIEQMKADVDRAHEGLVAAAAKRQLAARVHTDKLRLAGGEFDGKCPVAQIDCPAAATIRGMKAENAKAASAAAEVQEQAAREEAEVRKDLDQKTRWLENAKSHDAELAQLRTRGLEVKRRAQAAPKQASVDPMAVRAEVERWRGEAVDAGAKLKALEKAREGSIAARKEIGRLSEQADVLEAKARVWAEAARILGRNGAQRVIAEQGLSTIEQGANEILRESGIDLSVAVSWSREGDGLARACEACGLPFPASRKVKICEGCGAERGPHLVNKLELDLSDRSGAAEDLVGIALQISAARWLRRRRGSAWAVMLIDEPFGQLDEAHRRALSSHLSRMFAKGEVEQAFVIAHHSSVLEALPGRVEVVSEGTATSIRLGA